MSECLSIIIDADIARASGTSEHPTSSGSRALLEIVINNGHVAALCPKLMAEWRKHNSLFAKRWLSSMIAKKRVKFITPSNDTETLIEQHIYDLPQKNIALKDVHLIDAALLEDKVITSNDDNARNVFCGLATACGHIKTIKWFNAVSDKDFLKNYLCHTPFVPEKYYLKQV